MCDTVRVSATYAYVTTRDGVERVVEGVRRVKLKDGCVFFLGRKKRPLLVLSDHSFAAAWREDSFGVEVGVDGRVVVELATGRQIPLYAVDGVTVKSTELGLTTFHVLESDDEDLPVALVLAPAATSIEAR